MFLGCGNIVVVDIINSEKLLVLVISVCIGLIGNVDYGKVLMGKYEDFEDC